MRLLNTLRFLLALAVCLVVLTVPANLHMQGIILWDRFRAHDKDARRDRIDRWCFLWAVAEWRLFSFLMGISTRLRLPEHVSDPQPAIVIANHRSSIDVLLLPIVLHGMGYRKITAVVKKEVSRFPIIGTITRELGSAYVVRSRDPEDLVRIRECAERARENGACVMIFPEGTVLECGTHRGDYHEVLIPKTAGLRVIRETLPRWPVLSVTIDWGGAKGASSIYSAWTLIGRRITIEGRFVENALYLPLEDWLTQEWDRKERLLANASAGRLLAKIKRIRARSGRRT